MFKMFGKNWGSNRDGISNWKNSHWWWHYQGEMINTIRQSQVQKTTPTDLFNHMVFIGFPPLGHATSFI